MSLSPDQVAQIMGQMADRADTIRMAGGIPMYLVIDLKMPVPLGWYLDQHTDFYVPPELHLDEVGHG